MQLRSNRLLPEPTIDVDHVAGCDMIDLNEPPESESDDSELDDGRVIRIKKVIKKWKKHYRKDTMTNKELNDEVVNTIEPRAQSFNGVSGFEFVDPDKMIQQKKRKKNGEIRPTLMWEIWEEEHSRWIDNHIAKDIDLDQENNGTDEMHEEPSDLVGQLLRFQKEWLTWALKQEESVSRGGILADEMGMGKTVQAIALVLAKRELRRAIKGTEASLLSPGSSSVLPELSCTLVICPASALHQWKREIERFTREGRTKVLCYQGAKRAKNALQFFGNDFIITTYNTIEADYRKVLPPKQKCEWCGKCFYERRMAVHLRYYCGPNAIRTEKQSKQNRKAKKSHLKVSKKCAEDDISKINDNKLEAAQKNIGNLHDPLEESGSQSEQEDLGDVDANVHKSTLHSVKWERIVLDEAHSIKDRRSNTARAVLALQSSYKWALSGTPLQNRVGELYSLIRFLRIVPFSYYMCKDCDCRTLDYGFSGECKSCVHKSVRHFCWWNKNVATPIQSNGNSGDGQRAMFLLKNKILKSILLRRTKSGRATDLALPSKIVSLRRDSLDIREEDYYQSLYNESQAQFNTYVKAGTLMNNYAHIFDLLTRLRQAVDHPYLVIYSRANCLRNENVAEDDNGEQICGICHDPAEDPTVTSCGHHFCRICLIDFSSSASQSSCPSCSKPLTADFTSNLSIRGQRSKTSVNGFKRSSIMNRIQLDDFQTSTKIDALREEIRSMIERDGSAKGIVFSQFTSFLDLIMYSLKKSGITCVLLDGSMTITARDNAIKRFHEDSDCRIFLISLKAGGVALNLTVASHVYLMDPWWNPATERQAMDRIHRIGQYKPIRIVRFLIENTVEERILKLQEKKELVFEGTVGGSSAALAKLTEADLRFLFHT
ncbi:DNA repair protein RAD16 isoform X1 [Spinacia oleracea]|uniref:DNA repair protein RAD16 isoform X1 n=1 Tax=Spinacia oleracea TaxID=3562 RepID=A0A9R0IVN5_SPIOL|nr:DNA repair protein RAD16 isoform X1 [Spinacia oleracea]